MLTRLGLGLWFVLLAGGCQQDALSRLQRARTAVFQNDPDRALKEYRLALDLVERDPSEPARLLHARALKGAADVYYLELRDPVRAAEVYQELVRTCPETPEALEGRILLAELLHVHFRDLRGAIGALGGAIERNAPQSAELTYRIAKLYFELGDYQQATVEAERVQTKFEASGFADDALLLEAQGLAMMEGRAQDAVRAFQRLVDDHPASALVPHALFEMGKLKAEQGERELAIELWVRALDLHPDPALVQGTIARVRAQIVARTPTSVGDRTRALQRGPAVVVPVRHRTSVEAAGGTAEEAAKETPD
jgi:tetratricopeptide (TPR) repeat protein